MRKPAFSMRPRLSLAMLLAGLLLGLMTDGHSFGDASDYVLMADSLWNDGDLVYAPDDYARAVALHFGLVPYGLHLTRHDWGYGYGKSLVYPVLALPFYACIGPRGFFVLNGVLLAALVLLGADVLSHRLAWARAVVVSAGVVVFSVTPLYVSWIDPFLACSVLAAAALVAYRRRRPVWTAALVVTLAACRPPYAVLVAAPMALHAIDRDWHRLLHFTAAASGAAAIFLIAAAAGGEAWTPYAARRHVYTHAFPYDAGHTAERGEVGFPSDNPLGKRRWPDAGEFADATWAFFIGRCAGILVYFPGFVFCLLCSRRWNREKRIWGAALLATCVAIFVAFPQNYFGGAHAIGNRLFTLLPIAFIFVDAVAWRPWRVVAAAALASFALPLLSAPVMLSRRPGRHMAWAPYRYLPLEWTHLRRMEPPFTYPGMAAFTDNQFAWEGSGLWTRGGTTSELVFIRPRGVHPRVRVSSPLADVRIRDGGDPVAWRSESLELVLTHPVATTRDSLEEGKQASVYLLEVGTDVAFRPSAHGNSSDERDLGAFVQPLDRSARR